MFSMYLDRTHIASIVLGVAAVAALVIFVWRPWDVPGPVAPPSAASSDQPTDREPSAPATSQPVPGTGSAEPAAQPTPPDWQALAVADGVVESHGVDSLELDLELDGVAGLHAWSEQLGRDGLDVIVQMHGTDDPGLPAIPSDEQASEQPGPPGRQTGTVKLLLDDGTPVTGRVQVAEHQVRVSLRLAR